jgi:hypothetical protein
VKEIIVNTRSIATLLTLAGVLAGAPVVAPAGAAPASKKLLRQISVMEKVVDQVLVDSQNLMVTSRNPTHGVYLDEFGVLLTVETSIAHGEWEGWPFGNMQVLDGNVVVIRDDEGDADGDDEDHDTPEADEDDEPEARAAREARKAAKDADAYRLLAEKQRDWVATQAAEQEKRYEGGKEELLDALLDYAETMTALRDDQSVAIAAFISDAGFLEDRPGSRIVFKISMKDLRQATAGTITAEELRARVHTEEY